MKQIVQDGAKILRETAKPVPEELFDTPELSAIIKDMIEALDKEPEGVALAAPQIAVPYRMFVVRVDRTLPPAVPDAREVRDSKSKEKAHETEAIVEIYINPQIVKTSRRRADMDEGCLSVRGVYGTTRRHERVTIKAQRPDGSKFERGAGGIMAQIFEHEIDHLNGILFIDHADRLIHIKHVPAT